MSSRSLTRKEIRDRFVELRERLGWSVTEAAEELGVDQPSVSQWEGCKRPIPERHRREIAARAGEPETYLMVETPLDARRETRDRLIAAEWMERTAKGLRATPQPHEDDLDASAEAGISASDEKAEERKRDRRKKQRASGQDGRE